MAEVRECGESVAETLDEQFNEVRARCFCAFSFCMAWLRRKSSTKRSIRSGVFAHQLDQSLESIASVLGREKRVRVNAWLRKLREPMHNVQWKRNRNAYAQLLLRQLKGCKLEEPFDRMPPGSPLPTLPRHMAPAPSKPRTQPPPRCKCGAGVRRCGANQQHQEDAQIRGRVKELEARLQQAEETISSQQQELEDAREALRAQKEEERRKIKELKDQHRSELEQIIRKYSDRGLGADDGGCESVLRSDCRPSSDGQHHKVMDVGAPAPSESFRSHIDRYHRKTQGILSRVESLGRTS